MQDSNGAAHRPMDEAAGVGEGAQKPKTHSFSPSSYVYEDAMARIEPFWLNAREDMLVG